ncbi:MAG: phage distal tail protein [Mycobacteriaceae bacterium]
MTFKLPGRPVLAIGAQCLNRAIPVDIAFSLGFVESAALQFFCADPRLYGRALTLSTGLRTAGTGMSFPMSFPMSFGTTGSGGSVAFTNTGTANTEPVFTVSGALSAGFQITWVETGQHLTYSFPVGSDVVIDCGAGTATTQGQDRSVYLTQRDWFSVPAGATATFAFAALGGETGTSNPGVTFTAQVAPAYL